MPAIPHISCCYLLELIGRLKICLFEQLAPAKLRNIFLLNDVNTREGQEFPEMVATLNQILRKRCRPNSSETGKQNRIYTTGDDRLQNPRGTPGSCRQ